MCLIKLVNQNGVIQAVKEGHDPANAEDGNEEAEEHLNGKWHQQFCLCLWSEINVDEHKVVEWRKEQQQEDHVDMVWVEIHHWHEHVLFIKSFLLEGISFLLAGYSSGQLCVSICHALSVDNVINFCHLLKLYYF